MAAAFFFLVLVAMAVLTLEMPRQVNEGEERYRA